MKQKSLSTKIYLLFNILCLSVYRSFRKKPSTVIDFVTYPGGKESYKLEPFSPWRATVKLDKRIEETIRLYGIRKYKGIDLYKLQSHMLHDALLLIAHGIVEESDFTSDKPLSRIVSSSGTDFVDRLGDDIWQKAMDDRDMDRLARQRSQTEESYRKLHVRYATYLEWIMRNLAFTKEIDEFIQRYKIDSYLGVSLYDFDTEKGLREAFRAIKKRWMLHRVYFIESFQGKPLAELTAYQLENCELQAKENDFTHMTFDEAGKAALEAQHRKLEEEDQKKRDKRNAAARERRANAKDTVKHRNPAKKAAAEKPARKETLVTAKKTAMQKVAEPLKKPAPIKSIQPKKANRKKAS